MPEDKLALLVEAGFHLLPKDIEYLAKQLVNGTEIDLAEEISWSRTRASQWEAAKKPPRILAVQKGCAASFPLQLRHVTEYVRPNVVLIG